MYVCVRVCVYGIYNFTIFCFTLLITDRSTTIEPNNQVRSLPNAYVRTVILHQICVCVYVCTRRFARQVTYVSSVARIALNAAVRKCKNIPELLTHPLPRVLSSFIIYSGKGSVNYPNTRTSIYVFFFFCYKYQIHVPPFVPFRRYARNVSCVAQLFLLISFFFFLFVSLRTFVLANLTIRLHFEGSRHSCETRVS